jgi:hypothetical protein
MLQGAGITAEPNPLSQTAYEWYGAAGRSGSSAYRDGFGAGCQQSGRGETLPQAVQVLATAREAAAGAHIAARSGNGIHDADPARMGIDVPRAGARVAPRRVRTGRPPPIWCWSAPLRR